MSLEHHPESLYQNRFSREDRESKDRIWEVLCDSFFQKWVDPGARVVDLGAGYCEFINNIRAGEKHAVDLNEETRSFSAPDVVVHIQAAHELPFETGSIDVVFASNFFEHVRSKDDLISILREARRVLKPEGRILIMQPNFRFAYRVYWDFLDHHLPLTDRTMQEALELTGFRVDHVMPQFLPYSTKTKLPRNPWLVSVYLRFPPIWRVLGRQMFIVATPV
jgi:SAM-dependent methyltransferase